MIGRFMQEARAQARIDHENICKVYETGEVEGKPYIAMQLVDGLPLDKACRAMSLNEKAEVIQEVAKALHVAHEQDIIHRDIKPSNIMVERITDAGGATRYRPVLMDFGLARETSAGKGITETGAVMGTPHYMSPEQARGEARRLDRRSDVYSLGATLYELLTGEPPFSDETVVNILLKVMDQDAKPARSHNPAIPVALDTIVSKCLNKEPAQRYPTALALADDLGRFLSAQRIAARRLSYLYRIGYWARRKPAVATLTGALLTSLLCLTGYGLRTRIAQRQQEAQARRDADLAQRLGQTVKDLEWRMRTDYLLPLHNTEREKAAVRTQMAQIEQDLRSAGAHGVRLAHYALGRGHLALHEWQQAQEQLQQAERQGLNDRELDYALGRVLGERYRIALEEARKSGDPSFVAARQKELEQEFLVPARTYLARSRSLASVSPSYIEALIDFYHQRYDAALINAHFAQKQQPNLYEAIKLQGDVHMARALQQKDRGAYDDAEATFQHALAQYGRAAEVGRSDHTLHEAIAEAWVRQEENDMLRGRDPGEKMQQALLAAERALECAPSDSAGWTKKAYAYYFTAQTAQDRGDSATATALYTQQIAAGQAAARLHPEDAYAFESIGVAYESLAQDLAKKDQPISHLTKLAFENFEAAIKNNPRFPWAYNDYASTLMFEVSTYQATDPRIEAMLHRAAALAQQSINIDKSQTNSHIVLSLIYTELSRSLTERGLDSEKYLNMAEGHARDVLKLNPQYFFVFGNLGSLSIVRFIHHVDKNSDGQKDANEAIRCFGEFIRINSKVIGAYRELGRAYALHVGHLLSRGMPAESEIKAGHQVIQNCYRLEKDDAECQVHDALLFSAEAAWLLARRPTLAAPLFERALSIADSAQARLPKSLAASLSMGELGLRILLAEGVERSLRVHAYRSGVSALERALGLSPAWPRAQALLAALLAAGQGLAPSAEAQAQSKERARGLFAQAFVGNPLLKNRYAAMAAALHK